MSGTGTGNYGVFIGTPLAGGGASLSIEGIGGSSSGNNNYGVYQAAAISTTGSGTLALGGVGGGTGSGESGYYTVAPITGGIRRHFHRGQYQHHRDGDRQ